MTHTRQRLTLIGIFALFFGPVILVMLMRSPWWQYQPASLKNHGQLIQPPVQLALDSTPSIKGRWLILHRLDQPCDLTCSEYVTELRQIHRAAGRNRDRLGIVLLGANKTDPALRDKLKSIYSDFELVMNPPAESLATLDAIKTNSTDLRSDTGSMRTYILDPALNIILGYAPGSDPNDIHKDLKRLLKWSDEENIR